MNGVMYLLTTGVKRILAGWRAVSNIPDTVGHVWTRRRCQGEITRGTLRPWSRPHHWERGQTWAW